VICGKLHSIAWTVACLTCLHVDVRAQRSALRCGVCEPRRRIKLTEKIVIDGDLLTLYRWRFLLIFTFKPDVKMANALLRVKKFFGMVGDAEGHRVSWVASLSRTSCEGPIIPVCVAGIGAAFREHIRGFNKNSGHCHIHYSDLKSGIAYSDTDSTANPGVAHFWKCLETSPTQVLGALGLSDLRKTCRESSYLVPCRPGMGAASASLVLNGDWHSQLHRLRIAVGLQRDETGYGAHPGVTLAF
jgi:hypothetical protein